MVSRQDKTTESSTVQPYQKDNSFFDLRTNKGQILFIIVTTVIALLMTQLPFDQLNQIWKLSASTSNSPCPETINIHDVKIKKPTYWIFGAGGEGQWIHVNNVLSRLGFERVSENESASADLLWAHDYPFTKYIFTNKKICILKFPTSQNPSKNPRNETSSESKSYSWLRLLNKQGRSFNDKTETYSECF